MSEKLGECCCDKFYTITGQMTEMSQRKKTSCVVFERCTHDGWSCLLGFTPYFWGHYGRNVQKVFMAQSARFGWLHIFADSLAVLTAILYTSTLVLNGVSQITWHN